MNSVISFYREIPEMMHQMRHLKSSSKRYIEIMYAAVASETYPFCTQLHHINQVIETNFTYFI